MSIGHGACAKLVDYDDAMVMYAYCCYDINNREYKRFENLLDGEIYVSRDAFIEPEIHERKRRMPSGRKRMVVKRVKRRPPFDELFAKGKIQVKNASGTWHICNYNIDFMVLKILIEIFNGYQETGTIPQHIGVYY
ncbi:hypothetical protein [Anaerovibrio sp. RM50]|uniref:hypothetical protein n=1 Tax=Anaerovibrio sp. RM50 TaxID=1200557 RepID=UPI000482FD60|nr:hypothetical protein [Anaerovibrio sp. RM50]